MKVLLAGPIQKTRISGPRFSLERMSRNLKEIDDLELRLVSFNPASSSGDFEALTFGDLIWADTIWLTGVFSFDFVRVFLLSRFLKKKLVVSPRGNFVKAALRKSFFKKAPFILFLMPFFARRVTLHFLSAEERTNSFRMPMTDSIAAPNFVDVPTPRLKLAWTERRNAIVYIGRFDIYHKGLDLLVKWVALNRSWLVANKFSIHLFGSDYRSGHIRVKKLVDQAGLADIISIAAEVGAEKRAEIMMRSKFFCHFSRFEGVPQAVVEAVCAGMKVIATKECNLDDQFSDWSGFSSPYSSGIKSFIMSPVYSPPVEVLALDNEKISEIYVDFLIER